MTSKLGVGRDVGTPTQEPAVTVTSAADVASANMHKVAERHLVRWDGHIDMEPEPEWLKQGFNGA